MPKYPEYDDTFYPVDSATQSRLDQRVSIQDNSASIAAVAAAGAITASSGTTVLVDNTNTDWINNKYRPMMGWTYMAICLFDFMLAPIMWSVVQAVGHGTLSTQWQPLTLSGGGLVHVAFGAIIGVTAFGRTKEKLAGAA